MELQYINAARPLSDRYLAVRTIDVPATRLPNAGAEMPPAAGLDARPRWSRRGFLRLAVVTGTAVPVAALLGCAREGDDAAVATIVPTRTSPLAASTPPTQTPNPPTPSPTPTPAPTPLALAIELLPPTLGLGEAMRVRVPVPAWATGAVGTIHFGGSDYPLSRRADGSLWGVIGAALDRETVASLPLAVEVTTRDGSAIGSGEVQTAIVAVPRPVERLYVTEEQGAVLGGDAGPRELAIRQTQFATFDTAPPRWSGLFLRPTDGAVSTDFGGARAINDGPPGPGHTGTDLASDEGTPVRLSAPGRVMWAGAMPIRGNAVLVDHGAGVKSGYHHLSSIAVEVGDAILPAGTILGAVGSTGFATGPHLHWEVTVWGVNVDATTWLRVPFAA